MTAEEKQMQDMQANLKESGMSGTMYRREDLSGMMDKLGDLTAGMEGGEGGEEEEEEAASDAAKEEASQPTDGRIRDPPARARKSELASMRRSCAEPRRRSPCRWPAMMTTRNSWQSLGTLHRWRGFRIFGDVSLESVS